MLEKIINRQKEIKESVIKSLNELPSTDLMQISKIAKEIVDKRMEKCREEGLFEEDLNYEELNRNDFKNRTNKVKKAFRGLYKILISIEAYFNGQSAWVGCM